MTLIAGFQVLGTPVLIGDFLLTGSEKTSLRKKLLLVADNFALAWTGHLIAADHVVQLLQSTLDLDNVTLESVGEILTAPATSELGVLHVNLIGWIIDKQGQHCFRWNSSYPEDIFFGSPMYDGTGSDFISILSGAEGIRNSSLGTTDPASIIDGALYVTTNLMRTELIGPSTKTLGFGFAYEILRLVENTKFDYIDNLLYFAITHELDKNAEFVRSEFSGNVFKYEVKGKYALVNVYDPSKNDHSIHVITPVGFKSKQDVEALARNAFDMNTSFPFRSAYYCAFVRFIAPGFKSPLFCLVQPDSIPAENRIIDVENNALSLRIHPKMIEWMYKNIRKDQEK